MNFPDALKKPLSEETWACAIDVFGQKDLSIGEKINTTATADLHQATFKGQSVVAHGFHALREPFKHGLDEASMYASVVNMVSGQIARFESLCSFRRTHYDLILNFNHVLQCTDHQAPQHCVRARMWLHFVAFVASSAVGIDPTSGLRCQTSQV
jgi:hypothetical protein